jgi:hypothetical protein
MGPYVMRLRTLFYRGSARKLSLKCNFPQMTRIEDPQIYAERNLRRSACLSICEDQRENYVWNTASRGVSQTRAICYKINLCSIDGLQKNAGRQAPTYSANSHILITVPSITHLLICSPSHLPNYFTPFSGSHEFCSFRTKMICPV